MISANYLVFSESQYHQHSPYYNKQCNTANNEIRYPTAILTILQELPLHLL